jgi:hypothetical protein
MDDRRKRAYRHLLYWALLEIRLIAWIRLNVWRLLNPFRWRESIGFVRRAGIIADWLHNLAAFSVDDFEGFNEDWFWKELKGIEKRHPEYQLSAFRNVFEGALERQLGTPQA